MAARGSALARAVSDAEDRLISADEPFARLQLRCGGELPGTIAVPALLEAVRKSRRYELKLDREITAQTEQETITAWIRVEPREDGELGCEIVLRHWQAAPNPPENIEAIQERRGEIDRQLAELTARLDADQQVLTAQSCAPDLDILASAMRERSGRAWTEFVDVEGGSHHQPLHWRLLDGANVLVPAPTGAGAPACFQPGRPAPNRMASNFA